MAKLEASSPSKTPGAVQQELQGIAEARLRTNMHDAAMKEIQACMDKDESNQTPDGKIPGSHDAANPKWKEFVRPRETVYPLLSFCQVVEKYARQKP